MIDLGKIGRNKLTKGMNQVADAVKVTLGAMGRNVVIQRNKPYITKDGVTVARSIKLKDPVEQMGADLIKEVAEKVLDLAGDGTTTACVITQKILCEVIPKINDGANPILIKKGIERAVEVAVETIKRLSTPIDSPDRIKQIATISANGDEEIGQAIADAYEMVGKDGIVSVIESPNGLTSVNQIKGFKYDKGYLSNFFINNEEKQLCELDNVYILICDEKITKIDDLIPVFEFMSVQNYNFLIISDGMEQKIVQAMLLNKNKGILNSCVTKLPGYGDQRLQTIQDLALFTGATIFSEQSGQGLDTVDIDLLGYAERVIVSKDMVTIYNGRGHAQDIAIRLDRLKAELSDADSIFDKNTLQSRIANLSTGIAVIQIGGASETEIREKRDRVDDAVCATKSAMEEGYVAGAGTIYFQCDKELLIMVLNEKNNDVSLGIEAIKTALAEPGKQILVNAGIDPSVMTLDIVNKYGWGIDVRSGHEAVNLLDKGIIDPTKVARVALESAGSIAAIFITTECVISNEQ